MQTSNFYFPCQVSTNFLQLFFRANIEKFQVTQQSVRTNEVRTNEVRTNDVLTNDFLITTGNNYPVGRKLLMPGLPTSLLNLS